MEFKFDENFGTHLRQIFLDAGHNVETVYSEGLKGKPDERIFEVCQSEQRCLITLDLDFADILRFPPALTSGVIVVRAPNRSSRALMGILVRQALQMLSQQPIVGHLWIVEAGRIRIYGANGEDGEPR